MIKRTISYLIRLLKSPISTIDHVIITPPFFNNIIVLDKKTFKFVQFKTKCLVDYNTVSQVFIDLDYRLDRLKRADELRNLFFQKMNQGHKNLILDVGSNIGASIKYFERKWPDAIVWGIDPSSRNISLSKKNVSSEARLIHAALGNQDCHCTITNSNNAPNSFRVAPVRNPDDNSIEMKSMKSILKEANNELLFPFILKIDAEGAEELIFEDGTDWIDQWPILMVELHDWMLPNSASSKNVLKAISSTDRDVILQGNTLLSLRNKGI